MGELTEKERHFLGRLGWTQRVAGIVGLILTLLGGLYVAWAVAVFDYRKDPREQARFDRPVARLAFLFDGYAGILKQIRPETDTEKILLESMQRGVFFSTAIMVMQMRLYIGTLVCLMGLVALTVVVERRRLLRMIEKLNS